MLNVTKSTVIKATNTETSYHQNVQL